MSTGSAILDHDRAEFVIWGSALLGERSNADVIMNSALVSFWLLAFGAFAIVGLHQWQDVGHVVCGLWLMASPLLLDYSDSELRYVHFGLGAVPVVLAFYNSRKDWRERDLQSSPGRRGNLKRESNK